MVDTLSEEIIEGLSQWAKYHVMYEDVKSQKRECIQQLKSKVTELGVSIDDLEDPIKEHLTKCLDTKGIIALTDTILEIDVKNRTETQLRDLRKRNNLVQTVKRWFNDLKAEFTAPPPEQLDMTVYEDESEEEESEPRLGPLKEGVSSTTPNRKSRARSTRVDDDSSHVSEITVHTERRSTRRTNDAQTSTNSVVSDTQDATKPAPKSGTNSGGTSSSGSSSSNSVTVKPLTRLPCSHFRSLYKEKGLYKEQLMQAEDLARQIAKIAFSQSSKSQLNDSKREWALETDCEYVFGGRMRIFIANATLCNWGTMEKPWNLIDEEEKQAQNKKPRKSN